MPLSLATLRQLHCVASGGSLCARVTISASLAGVSGLKLRPRARSSYRDSIPPSENRRRQSMIVGREVFSSAASALLDRPSAAPRTIRARKAMRCSVFPERTICSNLRLFSELTANAALGDHMNNSIRGTNHIVKLCVRHYTRVSLLLPLLAFGVFAHAFQHQLPVLAHAASLVVLNKSKRRVAERNCCSAVRLRQPVLHVRDEWIRCKQWTADLNQSGLFDGLHMAPEMPVVIAQVAVPPSARPRLEFHRHGHAVMSLVAWPQLFKKRRESHVQRCVDSDLFLDFQGHILNAGCCRNHDVSSGLVLGINYGFRNRLSFLCLLLGNFFHTAQLVPPEALERACPLVQWPDCFGVGPIELVPPIAPNPNQAHIPQNPQML